MTVFGIRKNVESDSQVARRNDRSVATLDFNNSSVFQSPYFQLRQNDIVYIQPNKNKGLQASRANVWMHLLWPTAVSVKPPIIIASTQSAVQTTHKKNEKSIVRHPGRCIDPAKRRRISTWENGRPHVRSLALVPLKSGIVSALLSTCFCICVIQTRTYNRSRIDHRSQRW